MLEKLLSSRHFAQYRAVFGNVTGTSNGEQVLQRLANAIAPFKAEEILLPCNRRLSC
jgi:hypothetical protein